MKSNKAIALRIKALLKEMRMTQYRLAVRSGIPHATLNNIMQETIEDSLLSTIIKLSNGFDMEPWEFLMDPLFTEVAKELFVEDMKKRGDY